MKNFIGQQDMVNGMAATHFSFQAFSFLTKWTCLFRCKKSWTQFIQILLDHEHHNSHFISISAAATLTDHMLPLIWSCADDQYIS